MVDYKKCYTKPLYKQYSEDNSRNYTYWNSNIDIN